MILQTRATDRPSPPIRPEPARRLNPLERGLVLRLLTGFGNPPVKLILWNGEELCASAEPIAAVVRVPDRPSLLRMFVDPYRFFGDAYADGHVDLTGDLVQLLERIYRSSGDAAPNPRRWLRRNRNTVSGSRKNIHHHYDIGTSFYRLWLDSQLTYTCAYFPDESTGLEDAQIAKMDHVCRKLRLRPGERVVEAGCGWGSLALHMARRYGVKVQAWNISTDQVSHARQRAREEGLEDRVEFIQDDYRNIAGSFDVFVSVGMLEHVGTENYRSFGGIISRCLTSAGRGLIHTIGRHRPMDFNKWMDSRVFPGAMIPSLSEMMQVFEPNNLAVLDVENLRLHYALTLRHWLTRFEAAADTIAEMFDDRFVRMWRLYLAGSMAAFTTGWTQLYQVVFNRFTDNQVPLTRAHLYREP